MRRKGAKGGMQSAGVNPSIFCKPADRALYGWDANPWVWVIEFEQTRKVDTYL